MHEKLELEEEEKLRKYIGAREAIEDGASLKGLVHFREKADVRDPHTNIPLSEIALSSERMEQDGVVLTHDRDYYIRKPTPPELFEDTAENRKAINRLLRLKADDVALHLSEGPTNVPKIVSRESTKYTGTCISPWGDLTVEYTEAIRDQNERVSITTSETLPNRSGIPHLVTTFKATIYMNNRFEIKESGHSGGSQTVDMGRGQQTFNEDTLRLAHKTLSMIDFYMEQQDIPGDLK